MLKTSTSAKNLLLSVIPWQNVQTPRDHILVNVNQDTLELALSIVQVNIITISLRNAPITDISIFNYVVLVAPACACATKTTVKMFLEFCHQYFKMVSLIF
jgi:hypothetical protein